METGKDLTNGGSRYVLANSISMPGMSTAALICGGRYIQYFFALWAKFQLISHGIQVPHPDPHVCGADQHHQLSVLCQEDGV